MNRGIGLTTVNEILDLAEPSPDGLEAAIDEISLLQILFVHHERIDLLAQRMRAKVR